MEARGLHHCGCVYFGIDADVSELDREALKELLYYDPATGIFTRRVRRGCFKIGSAAGSLSHKGYIIISLFNKPYRAHRLVWLYMTGTWPLRDIDHKNGIRADNRFENLRDVTRSENMQNQRNASGPLNLIGVSSCEGGFTAKITKNYKQYHLGYFSTKEEAREAYLRAKRTFHSGAIWE